MSEIGSRYVTIYPKIAPGFSKDINAAVGKGAGETGKTVGKKIGDGIDDGIKGAAPKVQNTFKSFLGPALVLGAAAGIASFVGKAVSAFSDLEDATGAAEVVFGKAMDKVIAKSETAAAKLGMSKAQIIDAANTFGTLGKSANLSGDDLATFSNQMTDVAGSLSSFKGGSPEEAVLAVGAALRGESEPIRRYGVLLDDATLRQRALTLGIVDNIKTALTPQQRVLAAQAEILAQSGDAMGDFERTANSTANVQKTLAAESANLSAEIGESLAPMIVEAQKAGIGFLRWVTDNQAAIKPLVATVGVLTAAVGGFVAVSKGLEALKSARVVIAGIGDAFQAMSTKARIATASMGVIGVALTGASLAYGLFAQKSAEAKGRVEDFTAAIEADNGALGENVRLQVAKTLQEAGALEAARLLGIELGLVTSAVLGEGAAMEDVTARIAAQSDRMGEQTAESVRLGEAARTLTGVLGNQNAEFSDAVQGHRDVANAASGTTAATAGLTSATDAGKISFDDYTKAIQGTYNAQLKLSGSQISMEAAIDDGNDRVKAWTKELEAKYRAEGKNEKQAAALAKSTVDAAIKSGKALDINTKAGRDNRAALDSIASAGLGAVGSLKEAGASGDDVAKTMDRARSQFVKLAEKMGVSKAEAKKLATQLGLIKSKEVSLTVDVKWKGLTSKNVSVRTPGVQQGKAFGGPITGGIPGKDSVAALLMPDEHVLTTSDVKALGGHEGVFRMRELAQRGAIRFAGGGPVMPTYKGHSLDWWKDYLLTDLEEVRLKIRIKDLKADLAEREKYGKGKKKKSRYKLRDLERAEAQMELRDAEESLRLAQDAARANQSAEGTLDERIKRHETALKLSDEAASSWRSAAESLGKGGGIQVGGSWKSTRDAAGNTLYTGSSFSAADFVKQKTDEGNKVLAFVAKIDKLREMGAPPRLLDDILALGYIDGARVVDAFLADPSQLAGASSAYGKLDSARTQMDSIGTQVGAGAAGMQVNVTNNFPQAEPTSVTVNKALLYASAIGV